MARPKKVDTVSEEKEVVATLSIAGIDLDFEGGKDVVDKKPVARQAAKKAPANSRVSTKSNEYAFNMMQALVGDYDSHDVAHDENGKLIAGNHLSAQTFTDEVNRLIREGWQVASVVVYGLGVVGVTAGRITVKAIFTKNAKVGIFPKHTRFGMILMPETNSNRAVWNTGMEKMASNGFELIEVIPLGLQQNATNTLYLFLKYA